MKTLEKIAKQYAKEYPSINWRVESEEKTRYSPACHVIYFEKPKCLADSFIKIQDYGLDTNKQQQYELQIYLYPILKCYGEDTRDQNPTVSEYFDHYPTLKDVNQFLKNRKSTMFKIINITLKTTKQ